MLAAYATAAGLTAASIVVGGAVCSAAGAGVRTWLSPAVGLAALLLTARLAIRLPGSGWTAVTAITLAVVASILRLRGRAHFDELIRTAGPVAVLVLLLASLAFLASGRFGLLGVSVNDDPVAHLLAIDRLRDGGLPVDLPHGYPLAPHALAAAGATLTGDVSGSFIGLLLAVPVITATTALGALTSLRPPWRIVSAGLVGLCYLAAAHYAEASYKEPIMAALLLGAVLAVREAARGRLAPGGALVLLGLLAAGSVATYAYPGLLWPACAVAAWGIAAIASGGRVAPRRLARAVISPAGAAVVVALAVVLLIGRAGAGVVDLGAHYSGPGANLVGPIASYEVFGIYASSDFRYAPDDLALARILGAVALIVALGAVVWWVRRRDFVVPAGVMAGACVYAGARAFASPYSASKALVIVAPLTMLMTTRALFDGLPPLPALRAGRALVLVRWCAAVAFAGAAAWSSALALRGALVADKGHAASLGQLRPLVRGQSTLFLGRDNYVSWELRGALLSVPRPFGLFRSRVHVEGRGEKPDTQGAPFDFDSVQPRLLDRFRFAITTRTAYASVPPPNWRRLADTRFYTLWRREGPTPEQRPPVEGVAPGVLVDCATSAGARLSSVPGTALVRPAPLLGGPDGWRRPDGTVAPPNAPDTITAGGSVSRVLDLPPGRFDISLQFLGSTALHVRAPGLRTTLPPNLEQPGPWFSAGTITGGRRLKLTLAAEGAPALSVRRTVAIGAVAATPLGVPARTTDLRAACGRYVDHYVRR